MDILKLSQALHRPKQDEGGFTLIELLVVIAILAILAAVAIPIIGNRVNNARAVADKANVRMIQGAVELYLTDSTTTPSALSVDNLGDYLSLNTLKSPYGTTPIASAYPITLTSGKFIVSSANYATWPDDLKD